MRLTTWGKALEILRTQKGLTKSDLQHKRVIARSQYNLMLTSKRGPSVAILDRVLLRLGYAWDDWGRAIVTARSGGARVARLRSL